MTQLAHARPAPSFRLRLPRRTARLRLTALYGVLFLVSGVVLVASTYVLFQRATASRTPALPTIPHAPALEPLRTPRLPQTLLQLAYDQQQVVQDQHQLKQLPLAAGAGPRPELLARPPQLTRDERRLTDDQHRLARAVRRLTQAVHQVARAGTVQAAQRASDSHQLLVDSGIALALVVVLALLAGWLVAGRMLRPIRTITRTARRISSSSLHERLALDGPEDELKELGDTLDDLFARLEAAFESQRRFVAHASHELRTPLTRERALVQVALGDPSTPEVWRSTGQDLLASNRKQEILIDALLTLARSDSGLYHRERIDLAPMCEAALERREDIDRLELHVETTIRPAPLEGDPRLIERLVANLVDNAVGHNLAGGSLRVSTGTGGGASVLIVTNTGPLIPAGELDRLFQPFQRSDAGRSVRSGHGLGLSIVRAVATAHRGTVTAEPLRGGGLSVRVEFPLRP